MKQQWLYKISSVLLIVMLAVAALPPAPVRAAGGAPTRFYLQNAAASVTPATQGTWDATAGALTRGMSRTKSGAVANLGIAEANNTNNYDVLMLKFVSEPIPAQTIAAGSTLSWVIGSLESDNAANDVFHVHAYVVSNDGATLRGTLLNNNVDTSEWPTTAVGDAPATAKTLLAVNALANDRIVIEIGYQAQNNSNTSRTGTLWYGGTGGDLTAGGDETTLTGWFEFSQDLFPLNTTTAGVATATAASSSTIDVSMPYVDDGNANNNYTVQYCLTSANCPVSGLWTNWVTNAAHVASPYTTTITGLSSFTSYDVRVTYNDADGVTGTNPQTIANVVTLQPACSGSPAYTAPAGTNRVVVVVVSNEDGANSPTNVQIGGVAATSISTLTNGNARIFVGYRVIGTSAVSQAMNITSTNGECAFATTYQNINQTAGNGTTNTINSIATGTAGGGGGTTITTVNAFNAAGGAVNNVAGGQVVYAINMNNGTADGEVPTGASAAWAFSELMDKFATGDGNMTAVGQSNTTAVGSATISVGDNPVDNHNRSVLVAFALNPTSGNTSPTITSNGGGATAAVNVAENTTAVTDVNATDADLPAQTLTYSLVAGGDSGLFSIVGATGILTFNAAPNFEAPADAGANNVYDVTVQVADGNGGTDTQAIAITVTNANDAPAITSNGGGATAAVNVAENTTAVTDVNATDADLPAQTLTYSLVAGGDSGLFSIVGATGILTFNAAPNFEAPADAGANNVYDVTVQVADGNGGTDTQAIAITVTNANDAPAITSNGGGATAAVNVAENTTAVTDVNATDADLPAQTLTYSLVAGGDSGLFSIVGATGILTFNAAPNFEAPADAGANNVYDVTVQVSDGNGGTDTQAIAITVTAANDNNPVITSNGAGATAAVNVAENTTAVTDVNATDVDLPAQTLTYSISGGADSALFSIVGATGILTFNAAPNFEAPADAGANNVYNVTVQVSDGTLTDTQAITITVTDVAENTPPTITSNGGGATAAVNVAENTTAVTDVNATDADLPAQTLTYSLVAGGDSGLFSIVGATGILTFNAAPNFEAPADAGANNVYDVTVQVADGNGGTDTQAIAITVTNANDAPAITSNGGGATAAVNVAENTTAVTDVNATDADLPAQTLTYSLVAGGDSGLFSIVGATGILTFNAAPNFEAPADAGANNVYDVTVQVADGNGGTDTQAIAITVTAANDNNPVITSNGAGATAAVNVAENTTAVTDVNATDADLPAQTLTYSISGGADSGLFSIVGATGILTFNAAPNFEAPADAGANNVYDVTVQVSDGTLTDTQAIAVTLTDTNDAPVITSNGGGATASINVVENATAVTDVNATDADLPAQTLTYSKSGGADQALLNIDSGTGVLTFAAGPDFETPTDANTDNIYEVTVQVSDGTLTDTQAISVTITNIADETPPTVVITTTATDPTSVSPIPVTFTFSEPVTLFDISDIAVGNGTAGNFIGVGPATVYTADITPTTNGLVTVDVAAGAAQDASANGNIVAAQFTITYDTILPKVTSNGINSSPDTGDASVNENESIIDTLGITQLTVTFSKDVYDDPADLVNFSDDATNPANYVLVRSTSTTFATVSCALGVAAPDIAISVDSVTYSNGGGSGPFVSTLSINGGFPLNVVGFYRLYVCGTTSIVDAANPLLVLAGDGTTAGTDFQRNFSIATVATTGGGGGGGTGGASSTSVTSGFLIPVTGFAPNQITTLPAQTADSLYTSLGKMTIEIPTLGIKFPIVGASITNKTWDLTWLKDSVAYLEGSAYPTTAGNTVITAHVQDANKNLGPFSDIKGLQLGQKIYIHVNGQIYVYQVQESSKISPNNINAMFRHEEDSWITLVTCEDYNAKTGLYTTRRLVRAVLISVIFEKK